MLELASLTMEDVPLKKKSGHLTIRQGKCVKNRTVPLNSDARKAIREWMENRGEEPGMLFSGRGGGALTSRSVEYMLERISRKAGIEKVGPHVLRHTFCKSLIDAGVPLDRVALLAGHENLNTTERYTRASNSDLEKSVQRLAWE